METIGLAIVTTALLWYGVKRFHDVPRNDLDEKQEDKALGVLALLFVTFSAATLVSAFI